MAERMKCRECGADMYLDDKDYNFKGNMDIREETAELNYEAEYNRLKEEMARQKEENKYLREELKNKEKELRYYFGFGDACKLIFGRRYENGC